MSLSSYFSLVKEGNGKIFIVIREELLSKQPEIRYCYENSENSEM